MEDTLKKATKQDEPSRVCGQVERFVRLNWLSYPENKPKDCGKCLVELQYQGSLGLNKYLWLINWNCFENKWEDFARCDDIKKGAVVKRFIEDKYLW